MDKLQEAMIVARILNTGTIMSIEKNERELKGLEKSLTHRFKYQYCSLFNAYHGAIQGSLAARDLKFGDTLRINQFFFNKELTAFLAHYLGLILEKTILPEGQLYEGLNVINLSQDGATGCLEDNRQEMLVVDFSAMNYGSAAALLTNDQQQYYRAERLKIFGEPDLRTMWNDKEFLPEIPGTIQFNYRLSPLVAGLIKANLGGRDE